MKKITSMKILSLEMENFRNHTENERFEFGDMTFILGCQMSCTIYLS